MKTNNNIYTTLIMLGNRITVGTHFDYEEAKEILVHAVAYVFNPEADEALIFESEQPGEAEPVFNYRAFISSEEDTYEQPAKENKDVKLFFICPNEACTSMDGKLMVDDDFDIVMECRECATRVPVS